MDTPLELAYRGLEPTEATNDLIRRGVEELEGIVDQITSCRAMVELPNLSSEHGDLFRVRLDLRLPGGEVVVDRTPPLDRASDDLDAAIGEAFAAARRELRDFAQRRHDDLKAHGSLREGVVARLVPNEGYGFIGTPEGHDVYFHEHNLTDSPLADLFVGARVRFVAEQGEKGLKAVAVMTKS